MKLALALLPLIQSAPPAPQSAPPDPATALRTATLDDLIGQLPRVDDEGHYDAETDTYVLRPAARELERRLAAGEKLSDAQWKRALVTTGAVRLRTKWPATAPVAASMRVPAWLGVARIALDPGPDGLKTVTGGMLVTSRCGTCSSWDERADLHRELGTLALGKHELAFGAKIEIGKSWSRDPTRGGLAQGLLWEGGLPWTIEVVPTLEDAMPGVTSDAIDAAVRRSISVSFSEWGDRRAALLVLDPDVCADPCLADVALSIEFELVQGDEVRETYPMRASSMDRLLLGSSLSACDRKAIDFRVLDPVSNTAEADPAERQGWVLRVRGTSRDILRNWDANTYWKGRLEIPLDEAIRTEQNRAGSKTRGPWCWIPGPR